MGCKTITKAVSKLKARPEKYLPSKTIDSLYCFLQGWDMARGTSWSSAYTAYVTDLKATSPRAPGPADISFYQALLALETVIELQAETLLASRGLKPRKIGKR